MGLIDKILAKSMIIKWSSKNESNKKMLPEWYLAIEADYKNPLPRTRAEIRDENERAIANFSEMFRGLPPQSRMISGAVSLDCLLDHVPENNAHTNLDIIFIPQAPVLAAHFEAAKKANFYPMWRMSGKARKDSPIKYHIFKPTYAKEMVEKRIFPKINPELTRINTATNMIEEPFSALNHLKIYLHTPVAGGFLCLEDKKPIFYPKEYLRSIPLTIKGERILIVDPRYTYTKLKNVIETEENNYSKHTIYLTKLAMFLRENKKEFPIKGFNC